MVQLYHVYLHSDNNDTIGKVLWEMGAHGVCKVAVRCVGVTEWVHYFHPTSFVHCFHRKFWRNCHWIEMRRKTSRIFSTLRKQNLCVCVHFARLRHIGRWRSTQFIFAFRFLKTARFHEIRNHVIWTAHNVFHSNWFPFDCCLHRKRTMPDEKNVLCVTRQSHVIFLHFTSIKFTI